MYIISREKPSWLIGGLFILTLFLSILGSCSRLAGWGVLLWNVENPSIPSGTLVPVYIKSNIDSVYVIGIPKEYQLKPEKKGDPIIDKTEVPLWQIQFFTSKTKASAFAKQFAAYASLYAETLQDGLPVRAEPDNGARRVYRLRQGQVIKILAKAQGNPAMSGSTPLPGDWLQVLTDDGTVGYCFSYRLRIFEIEAGKAVPVAQGNTAQPAEDPALETVVSKIWYPDWYKDMVDAQMIDLDNFTDQYGFFPKPDTGVIRLSLPDFDKTYSYTSITKVDTQSWRFEGTPLIVTLRNENLLAVQYQPLTGQGSANQTATGQTAANQASAGQAGSQTGGLRTSLFVTLPQPVGDLIAQEQERRLKLLQTICEQGPRFHSENYGQLVLSEDGTFTWEGFDLLVPRIIPITAGTSGTVALRLFIRESIRTTYDGALTLYFNPASSDVKAPLAVNFLYKVEPRGLRLEYLPPASLSGVSVLQRSPSPIILYFPAAEQ